MEETLPRKLIAILAADIAGYSALMSENEGDTVRDLKSHQAAVLPMLAQYGGKLIDTAGDGILAEFASVVHALECAIAIQRTMTERNVSVDPARRMQFRMGVNLGDVLYDANRIYGEGVNIAARLEALAPPGGIYVSGTAHDHVAGKLDIEFAELGVQRLKNIDRVVTVYAVLGIGEDLDTAGAASDVVSRRRTYLGPEPKASIVVLPFRLHEVNGGGANSVPLADGFAEAIIHAISSLKDLFVISRGSTLAYAGGPFDAVAVGRKLGVRYALTGTVWRAHDRLRVNTELAVTDTGAIVSSEHVDGSLANLFELQDRLSLRLIRTVAPQIREREIIEAARKPPQSMNAYDLYLRALDLLYRMEKESFAAAGKLLRRAIELDPTYVPPHTYAALWHVFRVGEFGSHDVEAEAKAALELARTAVGLDGNDALALAICGHVEAFLLRDIATAKRLLDRAIVAGPSVAMAWTMSSATRGFNGEGALAIAHGERGQRLAPADPYSFWHEGMLAQAHYIHGSYDEAVAWARSAIALNPAIRFTLRVLAASLAAQGKLAEARAAGAQLLALQPDFGLQAYTQRCPFVQPLRDQWIGHLRTAGLPG